jgi:hypothetical protein
VNVTLIGTNFGLPPLQVLVGGQPCKNPVQPADPIQLHRKVVCRLPLGNTGALASRLRPAHALSLPCRCVLAANRAVLLVQREGDFSKERIQVSYRPCGVGYYAAAGAATSCSLCPQGSLTL